jgi:hypothetical protein
VALSASCLSQFSYSFTAQRHVNTTMFVAAAMAGQVPGIHAAFQDYTVR